MKLLILLIIITQCLCSTNLFETRSNFAENLSLIAEKINKNPKSTWRAVSPTKFNQMQLKDAKKLMGVREGPEPIIPPTISSLSDDDLPTFFDSREKWPECASVMNIPWDQGNCGSCWAVAAAAVISDRICIQTGRKIRISARDIFTCQKQGAWGCDGGYPSSAWDFALFTGVVSGGDFTDEKCCSPYPFPKCAHHVESARYEPCLPITKAPACVRSCQATSSLDYFKDKKKWVRYYNKAYGEINMQKEILKNGPVEISLYVHEDFLTYKEGVYQHTTGKLLGKHAMKIVGWGVEKGVKYWIVGNTWNEEWGDKGYLKYLRGVNHFGIEDGGTGGTIDQNA